MKKIKLLIPAVSITSLAGIVAPMTSCAPEVIETYTVSLYANDGSFEQDNKILSISNIEKDTKLKDVKGYKEPTLAKKTFACWTDESGNVITGDTVITSNMLLQANFDDVIAEPVDFETDSWATVLSVCDKGFVAFANTYLEPTTPFKDDEERLAIGFIKEKMIPSYSWSSIEQYEGIVKPIDLTFGQQTYRTKVRLIGINHDIDANTHQRTRFTFGFVDIIDVAAYDINGNGMWYTPETSEKESRSCFLRRYLNENLIDALPIALRKGIKTVEKTSPIYDLYDYTSTSSIVTDEKLFPLSLEEMNLPAWFVKFTLELLDAPVLKYDLPQSVDNAAGTYEFYKEANVETATEGEFEILNVDWLRLVTEVLQITDIEERMNAFISQYGPFVQIFLYKTLLGTDIDMDYWIRTGGLEEDGEEVPSAFGLYEFSSYGIACPGGVEDIALGVAPAFCI